MTRTTSNHISIPAYWPVNWPRHWHSTLTRLGFALTVGALVAGCQPAADEAPSAGPLDFESLASADNLTAEEWRTFREAQRYIDNLVPLDTPVAFNHADEQQHRFVLLRMKLMGKTAKNSPELFAQLKSLRSQHKALGVSPGLLFAVDNGHQHSTQHYFSSVDLLDDVTQEVLCTLSAKEDADYSFADCAAWDVAGTPIGDLVWTERYGSMPYTTLATTGDLNLTALDDLEADSYIYQDLSVSSVKSGASIRESYIRRPQNRRPRFTSPSISAPVDSVSGACISVCLSRNWTGDCDYNLTGRRELKIPLAGCVSFDDNTAGSYRFDQDIIDDFAAGSAQDPNGNPRPGGRISVILADVGGGCNVNGKGQLVADMKSFWSSVSLSNNDDTLCWDMTGNNAMEFDDSCRQVQDKVELTMHLTLPWIHNNGSQGASNISMTNNESSQDKDIACIKVTNSCLAAGTMIELASGSSAAIESIESGDLVSNPFGAGNALTVTDTAKGLEEAPMVRITTDSGHNLLLTEMHPVDVVGRGMIQARYLATGDVLTTKAGPSALVSVARESYDGQVYNLKVGSEREAQVLGADQTVMYANGILVGDGQIQDRYESLARAAMQPAAVGTPAARWQRDYKHSSSRKRALQQPD